LSTVYLVRHGQAGTRDAYDSLSEQGKKQSRLLGEHWLAHHLRFDAAYAGGLRRQQQTAEEVTDAYVRAGISFPAVQTEAGWNEFDLADVYREIAPQLCADSPEFRREYLGMLDQVRTSGGRHAANIHRKWQPCDTKIVNAWIHGRYVYRGEGWTQFCERVSSCKAKIGSRSAHENIVIFTSAMPIAIWVGVSLEIFDQRLMRIAGVLYNTSQTILRLRDSQLKLFTFNAAPHLTPAERSHR
jgi:broad specificity phosphatase PhoE